jgi:hypothetical protein
LRALKLSVLFKRLFAKLQEVICPKGASFSAIAASAGLWALLKVRSKQKKQALVP